MSTTKEEQLLKSLAVTIIDNPRSTIKELAESIGISKATLHRFCGTRDNLEKMLIEKARISIEEIIFIAKEDYSDFLEGFKLLINAHYKNKEFLRFTKGFQLSIDEEYWSNYIEALDYFFLNGQKKGIFKIDFNVSFLTELFIATICGMVDGEKTGRLAKSGLTDTIEKFYLFGSFNN